MSVVMSVRNGLPYVIDAAESILSQTYSDLELIIVDDASTDGSGDALRALGDPRIKILVNGEGQGLAESLNLGITASTGEFVARIDADDLSEQRRLERQVGFLDDHPGHALVGSFYEVIGADGQHLGYQALPCGADEIRWALEFYCPIIHSAALMRRSCWDEVGGYDGTLTYAMDYDLWRRLSQRFALANLPLFLVSYREGHASMTATYGDRTLEGEWIAIRALAARVGFATEPSELALERLSQLRLLAFDGNEEALIGRGAFMAARQLVRVRRLFMSGDARGTPPSRALLRFRVEVTRRAIRRGLHAARRGDVRSAGAATMAAVGAVSP